ncbi:MAG: glycosyltransferase [Bacteroidia bacterium]|nr:glycosyltransferase [Bacteroidia bacterium]
MSRKKNILIFIDWYKPGFKAGGPIQSCANLINHLKGDFCFSVITRNTDYGDDQPYAGITPNTWIDLSDGNKIYYLSKDHLNVQTIASFITDEYDIVYLNSFFSFYFAIIPLITLRFTSPKPSVILAPRGMLGSGALNLKSSKKKIFVLLSKIIGLYKHVVWHASTNGEAEEIKKIFPRSNVRIALNLPPKRELKYVSREKKKNELKLFFLSRISPKKNLLKVFELIEKVNNQFKIEIDIIGPVEDENYWKACEAKMIELKNKKNIRVNYKGAISNESLSEHLIHYHFMVLPTLNENFGHVILDSLSAGCPVIISDQTPWRDLQQKGIGWDVALTDDAEFIKAIETSAKLEQGDFNVFSAKAFETAVSYYNNAELVKQNKNLFGFNP